VRVEILRRGEAGRDPPPRDRYVRDVKGPVDKGDARILDAVLLDIELRRDRRDIVDLEGDAVVAACETKVAHLREVVGVSLVGHTEHTGAVPVADGARVPEVEARYVLRYVGHDHPWLAAIPVEEADADDVMFGVPLRERA